MERYYTILRVLIGFLIVGLFLTGDIGFFVMSYLTVFGLLVVRTLVVPSDKRLKKYLIVTYLIFTVAQIYLCSAVTFSYRHDAPAFYFFKLFSTMLIFCPFLVERFVTVNRYARFYLPSSGELFTVSFSEIKSNLAGAAEKLHAIQKAGKSFSANNVNAIYNDLHRHNSFSYVNQGSLTDDYFRKAEDSLFDPFLYIVISNTGSPASEMISTFTQKQYNHASLSFDKDLETIISYNGGERVYAPGLNREMIAWFNKKSDSSIIVYKLSCTREQKRKVLNKVYEINKEGSAYNVVGLVLKYSHKPNIMFCSQFVYNMLELAGLSYFQKQSGGVKPTDLVELDYHRKLQFAYELDLNLNK